MGNALLLQGNVLLDVDIASMLRVLRVPTEKLSPDGLAAARERLTAINTLCAKPLPLAELRTALTTEIAVAFGLKPRSNDGANTPSMLSPSHIAAERTLSQSINWENDGNRRVETLV